jgi:serine phosphatase RsbU (regulator of sigma subunit)/anti-sigma regulatory factor (Ser/Thr protein kinase)/transposase
VIGRGRKAQLTVEAREIRLREVRDFVGRVGRTAGLSAVDVSNCKLAVDEACTNIVRHAYRDDNGTIEVHIHYGRMWMEIRIRDRGTSFDFDAVQAPDLDQYVAMGKRGGLGVYLINRIMDSVEYTTRDGVNELVMLLDRRRWVDRLVPGIDRSGLHSSLRMKFFLRASLGLCLLVTGALGIVHMHQRGTIIREARSRAEAIGRQLAGEAVSVLADAEPYSIQRTLLHQSVTDLVRTDRSLVYARIVRGLDGVIWCDSELARVFQRDVPATRPGGLAGSTEAEWTSRKTDAGARVWELRMPVRVEGSGAAGVELGTVVLGLLQRSVTAELHRALGRTVLIGVAVLALGMVFISLMVNLFVKPIQQLTEGVLAIGDGVLHEEIQVEGPEEISTIARAFNEIAAKFRQAQGHLVEKERLQKEMQVAREIQETLLPKKMPQLEGYDISAFYKAALEVGGDYYDFVVVDDDTTGVVVADVSGKGVPGSLVMTMIRTALRMEARGNHSASDVMTRMNAFVTEDMRKGMFITLFYVILDSRTRVISYASAGHNPMLLLRAESDEVFFLKPRGFPVGISLPDPDLFRRTIDVERVQLQKDDMLLVYTDGVTEAMNAARDQYGIDRLVACLRAHGRQGADEFIAALRADVGEFTGDIPQHDDITVVAIKEKVRPAELEVERRKRLLDMVDQDGLSIEQACERHGVSQSTFYRWRKLRARGGDEALASPTAAAPAPLRRLNVEERKLLLLCIRDHPEHGAKRLARLLRDAGHAVDDRVVYDELVRLRLNNRDLRVAYLRRRGMLRAALPEAVASGETPGSGPWTPDPRESLGERRPTGEGLPKLPGSDDGGAGALAVPAPSGADADLPVTVEVPAEPGGGG